MADEISVRVAVYAASGSYVLNIEKSVLDDLDQLGDAPGVVEIGTSEEVISFGDVLCPGWCLIENLDATNYVDMGPESSGAMVNWQRIEAGKVALVFLYPNVVVRAKANTAAVRLLVRALNNGTLGT